MFIEGTKRKLEDQLDLKLKCVAYEIEDSWIFGGFKIVMDPTFSSYDPPKNPETILNRAKNNFPDFLDRKADLEVITKGESWYILYKEPVRPTPEIRRVKGFEVIKKELPEGKNE